ncbi:adenylyltransferase/cytidyltransferase family protein [Cryobacterium sp. 1639]|uniref:PfkB family carbohydrate kinase n=1 Tax=Cryobacterium inferilacus TaxID=2866629 RepID=UPI001C73B3F7|nr:PfkB family carbohydrate kinase [Cryobacterium sp. 1639]MBX0299968.1 adenylyltransferase/cytidyltransferase family protein [Cryobacterium sp. 1639]
MRIVVVGDVLLDVDIAGTSERLSPDAPVPVVDVTTSSMRAGGAGLVAVLLAADSATGPDGAEVTLVTAVSDDARSRDLRRALAGVRTVAGYSPGPTPVKTRVRTNDHAVTRIDEGCGPVAAPQVTAAMLETVAAADAIVVADYGRGLAADPAVREALDGRRPGIPLVWDPHPRGALPVASATVVTPNLAEAALFSGRPAQGVAGAGEAAGALAAAWGCGAVVVTLGALGALLLTSPYAGGPAGPLPLFVPAVPVGVPDACGAGDRFAASLTLALARDAGLSDSVRVAVRAAGAFLTAGGVSALGRPAAPPPDAAGSAATLAGTVRAAGGTVVATGGCFDLLHAGHARTLAAARRLGDCLIVCLNSDDSVRRLKGENRPILAQQDRVDLLLALECVDAVLVFDEDTPEKALESIRPDLWVKGGDYTGATLPESALMQSWGGQSVTVPYIAARSTTLLAGALARVG